MIKAVITDFDGTLVDTFLANCCAYCQAFTECGLHLSVNTYKECFGLRFDEFMETVGITDIETKKKIKDLKKAAYPNYFHMLKLNTVLYNTLKCMKESGIKIAIASTATRENLINVLNHLGISDVFDLIFTGENVKCGKPDPEIYILTMEQLGVTPNETIIYEDSDVGIKAAETSKAKYIKVTKKWFEI